MALEFGHFALNAGGRPRQILGSVEPIRVQGRTLAGDDVAGVGALIAQHPDAHRLVLSLHLGELWTWRNSVGRLKGMAACTLLLKLERKGRIKLPPPRSRAHRPWRYCAAIRLRPGRS